MKRHTYNASEIIELYKQGLSISKICIQLNLNRKTTSDLLKTNGIEFKKRKFYARKYFPNEQYFDQINTEEKAYMLGFIYADGNNFPKKNRLAISLSIIDKDILQKFSNAIYGAEILKFNKRKQLSGKEFEYVTFLVHSEHISNQLKDLGVMENKSYKITFPKFLDKSLYKHFIRGLIDGDGWIYLPKSNRDSPNVGLICTRDINNFLINFYKNELGINSILAKANKQDLDVMCEIRIKNYKQCKIILDWLYNDATIYLNRKYDLYKEFLLKYENLRGQNK